MWLKNIRLQKTLKQKRLKQTKDKARQERDKWIRMQSHTLMTLDGYTKKQAKQTNKN